MKSIIVAACAAVLLLSPAHAGEVSVKLDDSGQNAVGQLPTLLDQCVAGLTIRGDGSVCRTVGALLVGLVNEMRTAQTAAAKAAADKATADEAANKAAAQKPADKAPPSP